MKPRVSFWMALLEVLRTQLPYWAYVLVLLLLCEAVPWLRPFAMASFVWMGIGAYVVFVKLRVPHLQDTTRLDLGGALRVLYRTAWWPWYVWKRWARKE